MALLLLGARKLLLRTSSLASPSLVAVRWASSRAASGHSTLGSPPGSCSCAICTPIRPHWSSAGQGPSGAALPPGAVASGHTRYASSEDAMRAMLSGTRGVAGGPVLSAPDKIVPSTAAEVHAVGSEGRPSKVDYEVIRKFKEGFGLWKKEYMANKSELYAYLSKQQTPKVMTIACSDSRVNPTILFRADPGDIFSIRNVANLVPPYETMGTHHGTSAALEFAVCVLQVQHIIVLGHTMCGGIRTLMKGEKVRTDDTDGDFIDSWVKIALPAKERTLRFCKNKEFDAQCAFAEKESINVSLGNLLTFPWIKEKVNRKELALHGWLYDIAEGSLSTWSIDYRITEFEKIE